ncbi:MAG TPA: cytochrome c [Alphaproteobacteria bacterium]|jgi:mono/diheme cytochrome c family protein|nr:cytochrome c [Alphaproteobacteria bacterium]MDP6272276.1 cytochrome c [Alphaproteobacteria bacterium]MDP7429010.1 cytochrome c [Alphaproteobacteria bacterium]HJM50129.1 cytochrome c [Alphaproteobacteria bacterium]
MRIIFASSLALALSLAASGPARADAAAGKAAFAAQKCEGCHYTEGPAREKSIDDQLAKKGPELWYAGSKFQAPWLEAWLQKPDAIRPLKYNTLEQENPGDHPKLSGGDAKNVAAFLMSLTSDAVKAGKVKAKRNAKGRLIFSKKMPCSGCHSSIGRKKKVGGGRSGPTLVGAGQRLNPDWILAYLKTPDVFKPIKAMPVFAGILGDKDMLNLARHVASFK